MKQIISIELNMVAGKRHEDFNLELPRTNPANCQAGLELEASKLKVQHSNRSTTLPPHLTGMWEQVPPLTPPHLFPQLTCCTYMLLLWSY